MILCAIGIHKWIKWTEPGDDGIQYRACDWCGRAEMRDARSDFRIRDILDEMNVLGK